MTTGGMDDPNKRQHIFGNLDHGLDLLVRQYGSEEAASRAVFEAVRQAYAAGALILCARGRYRQVFEIGGHSVTVSGRSVNGVVRVGSAWIRPSGAENRDG